MFNLQPTSRERRVLRRENEKWPAALKPIPRKEWPSVVMTVSKPPIECWRSREFLVTVFAEMDGVERLSVCRTDVLASGDYRAEIAWDDLQRLKRECGRGDREAVEIYPADPDVVNVASMRHLWVLPRGSSMPFTWKRKTP